MGISSGPGPGQRIDVASEVSAHDGIGLDDQSDDAASEEDATPTQALTPREAPDPTSADPVPPGSPPVPRASDASPSPQPAPEPDPPSPAPAPTNPPPTSPPTTTAPAWAFDAGCESYMFNEINKARSRAGQPALVNDTGILHIPRDWTTQMMKDGRLSHNPYVHAQIQGARGNVTTGENVGTATGAGPDRLFQWFMDSPGHRANIEGPQFTHGSVGCILHGNTYWVTQNFWGP